MSHAMSATLSHIENQGELSSEQRVHWGIRLHEIMGVAATTIQKGRRSKKETQLKS